MSLFRKVFLFGGCALFMVAVVLLVVFFMLPRETAYAPVVPEESEESGEVLKDIVLAEPVVGAEVGFPLRILGQVRISSYNTCYVVRDDAGTVLAEGRFDVSPQDVGQFSSFDASVRYAAPTTSSGVVEVFSCSAQREPFGDIVRVPVIFSPPVSAQEVFVYFVAKSAMTGTDCTLVTPVVRRILPQPTAPYAAIYELLEGPSSSETEEFLSLIPASARVRSLFVEGGIATITFAEGSFNGIAGSCRVLAIRAQVEATLRQFSSVTSVIILEEGKPADEVLQP